MCRRENENSPAPNRNMNNHPKEMKNMSDTPTPNAVRQSTTEPKEVRVAALSVFHAVTEVDCLLRAALQTAARRSGNDRHIHEALTDAQAETEDIPILTKDCLAVNVAMLVRLVRRAHVLSITHTDEPSTQRLVTMHVLSHARDAADAVSAKVAALRTLIETQQDDSTEPSPFRSQSQPGTVPCYGDCVPGDGCCSDDDSTTEDECGQCGRMGVDVDGGEMHADGRCYDCHMEDDDDACPVTGDACCYCAEGNGGCCGCGPSAAQSACPEAFKESRTTTENMVESNSFGVVGREFGVEIVTTVSVGEPKPDGAQHGSFEFYDKATGGNHWYAEGGLWFAGGVLVDQDGTSSLPGMVRDMLTERGFDTESEWAE